MVKAPAPPLKEVLPPNVLFKEKAEPLLLSTEKPLETSLESTSTVSVNTAGPFWPLL